MKKAVTNKKVSQEKADLTDLEGVLAAKAAIMNVLPLTNGAIDGEEHTRILGFLNKWEKALQEEEDEKNWQKEEIKMGDVLIAIDENNQGSCGSVKGVATLIIGKEYPVCYVDYPKGKFGVISEIGCPHCFHISEYRNAFKHKSGLNEGDVLIAISECIMTPGDEVALKIGKEYPILSIFESQEGEYYFIVRDELSEEHSFHACGYKEFFKRKSKAK